jgi:hypothetical protein
MENDIEVLADLLEQISNKLDTLEQIDKSIDFLAAAMTGMDPLDIEFGQKALGRLALPRAVQAAQAAKEVEESVQIDSALLEEIIEDEIRQLLTPSGKEN